MSKNGKFVRSGSSGKPNSKLIVALSCIAAALAILVIVLILLIPRNEPPAETTVPTTTPTSAPTTVPPTTVPPTTIPEETEAEMLSWMVEYYEKNQDVAGWLKIDGIKADGPVMYVQGDNFKYLYSNLEGKFHAHGLFFIDGVCNMDPESDNLVIYGHKMLDGTMFGQLQNYANEEFWKEHPIINFSTLYEEREYEIVAAFYDRIYDATEDTFKFYQFIDAMGEEHFNEAVAYYKEHAEYDTGVTPEYGDHLITLVTCSYHCKDGRFVVVARQIVEEPEAETEPTE